MRAWSRGSAGRPPRPEAAGSAPFASSHVAAVAVRQKALVNIRDRWRHSRRVWRREGGKVGRGGSLCVRGVGGYLGGDGAALLLLVRQPASKSTACSLRKFPRGTNAGRRQKHRNRKHRGGRGRGVNGRGGAQVSLVVPPQPEAVVGAGQRQPQLRSHGLPELFLRHAVHAAETNHRRVQGVEVQDLGAHRRWSAATFRG